MMKLRIHPALLAFLVLVLVSLFAVYVIRTTTGVPEGYLVTSDPGAIYIRERIIPLYMNIVAKDLKGSDGKKVNDTLLPLLQEMQMINNSPDKWSSKGTQDERTRSINISYIGPINKVIQDLKVTGVQPLGLFAYPKQELTASLGKEIDLELSAIEKACNTEYDACIARGMKVTECIKGKEACEVRLKKGTQEKKGLDSLYGALAASAQGNPAGQVSPELEELLRKLQGTAATAGPNVNLGLSQLVGAGTGGIAQLGSLYSPNQTVLAPHQIPTAQAPSLTPIQPQAPAIPLLTPSVRQQIRDDVRDVVQDELNALQEEGFNSYEIQYKYN
jgi:hypothetical protein